MQKEKGSQEKPFACDVQGCDMTFTNKDHLDWHRKKHEMMLNLGLVNKISSNDVADQTPTPTRFIRNCEEIGLFQDLQNVNPFDEIFKRAVKNGDTVITPSNINNNSDDTLHTPHIIPHNIDNKCLKNNSDCEVCLIPGTSNDSNSSVNVRKKIKENIKNKLIKDKSPPILSKGLIYDKNDDKSRNGINSKENKSKIVVNTKLEKLREMNRAAQNRCRKRKRQMLKEMMEQFANLRKENENLKRELKDLKLLHSKCGTVTNQGAVVTSIITEDSSQPIPTKITSPSSLLIQILPIHQLPLVSPETSTSPNFIKHKDKSRHLRKIVPNILKKTNQ
ncbi:uncharacterized protein LOC130450661 [Diorhabda sublineata]|uniref:uncharacterized protein LOC130450661 n=1 Tax=Diorhabda sublineata TaxID=1163346 RepID=UPI0024E0B866|nr:uncharacterized protein LOC130450661 [Diorhabda sublineata]